MSKKRLDARQIEVDGGWYWPGTPGCHRAQEAKIERLNAVVAELRHHAECHWYGLGVGQWARDHCQTCRRLWEAVEATMEQQQPEKTEGES